MKVILKCMLVVTLVATTGYGVYTNQRAKGMSDLALANVEALAQGVDERPDCMKGNDICSGFVSYPDGDWGEDMLLGYKKKPGWGVDF